MTDNWLSTVKRLRSDMLIVRRYERPEMTDGGIVIPPSWKNDRSGTLWEAVLWGDEVEAKLGLRLHEGAILKTKPMDPIPAGDPKGQLWFIRASRVQHVQPWKAYNEETNSCKD